MACWCIVDDASNLAYEATSQPPHRYATRYSQTVTILILFVPRRMMRVQGRREDNIIAPAGEAGRPKMCLNLNSVW